MSVTQEGWRLIRPMTPPGVEQLFHLPDDPGEERNMAEEHRDRADALSAEIDALLESPRPWSGAEEVELDAMRLEQLRALGYLGLEADPTPEAGRERQESP